tara:strand:- start:4547 stop:5101 length:555 start_codon:yes stop_codon:yes gene_type:complete
MSSGKTLPKVRSVEDLNPVEVLTAPQRLFLEARLQGLNQTQAAKAAGATDEQAKSHGHKYAHNPKIVAAAKWSLAQGVEQEFDRDLVLGGLMDAVESAATSTELTMAWREIGKVIGAYAPERTELIVGDMTPDRLRQLSEKELLGLVDQGKQAPEELVHVLDGEFEVLRTACEDPVEIERGHDD